MFFFYMFMYVGYQMTDSELQEIQVYLDDIKSERLSSADSFTGSASATTSTSSSTTTSPSTKGK